MKATIVGRVAAGKDKQPRISFTQNGAVVNVYCGTQYKKDENQPDVHINVAVWFSYANDVVKGLKADDVIFVSGELTAVVKDGISSVKLENSDANVVVLKEEALASWGVYPYSQETGYINGVFPTENGGYNINMRTSYYAPYYKKVPSSELYERVKKTVSEQIRYYVPKDSPAAKSINALLNRLTGKTEGYTQNDLDTLKHYYICVLDSFQSFSQKAGNTPIESSLYLNSVLQRLMFIYKREKNETGTANNAQPRHQQQPAQGNQPDDIPFGSAPSDPNSDAPSFPSAYDEKITF